MHTNLTKSQKMVFKGMGANEPQLVVYFIVLFSTQKIPHFASNMSLALY